MSSRSLILLTQSHTYEDVIHQEMGTNWQADNQKHVHQTYILVELFLQLLS